MKKPRNVQIPEQLLIDLWSYHLANIRTPELEQRIRQGLQEKYDKFPYGKPQTDEVARGSGNREYGCQRLREKLPNVRESLFLEPGIPIV